jgi:flagellar secretion chaperone FliS
MFTRSRSEADPATGLYRNVQVDTAVAGATPHQLIALLFAGFQSACSQARGAILSGNVSSKGRAIGRAVRIIDEGLKAGLNLEAGGALARDLNELYAYITLRLTHANLHGDEPAIAECQRLIQPLQEAWSAIADQINAAGPH